MIIIISIIIMIMFIMFDDDANVNIVVDNGIGDKNLISFVSWIFEKYKRLPRM